MNKETPKPPAPPSTDPRDLSHPANIADTLGDVSILETDNLDETVLGAAAIGNPDTLPPEVDQGTADLTEWDEPPGIAGRQVPLRNEEDEESAARKLVESGIQEADREQRVAAADEDDLA